MSDVSEQCYAASWMQETEHAVWEMMLGSSSRWGQCDSVELRALLDEIKDVASRIGFWIVWKIGDNDVSAVPLAEWIAAHELGQKVAGL